MTRNVEVPEIIGCLRALAAVSALVMSANASAATHDADPASYAGQIPRLAPGDVLELAPGIYEGGLTLDGVRGRADAPIVIEGPATGRPAVFLGSGERNTVSIRRASYVTLRNIHFDGRNMGVDAIKAESGSDVVHHLTLEGLTIVGYGGDQQVVAISTKAPAAYWTIRNNIISGAGTGIYLGNSDGTAPFVAGTIENNVIVDTIGYNIEIKQQNPRPAAPDLPITPERTRIRGNVFSKARNASEDELARPNVLVGHEPLSGPGTEDAHEIAGNVFLSNPHEALVQGEGNVVLRRNLLLNPSGPGIAIQKHHAEPRRIVIVDNWVVAQDALHVSGVDPRFKPEIARNEVFNLPTREGVATDAVVEGADAKARFARWIGATKSSADERDADRATLLATLARACDLTEGKDPWLRATPLSAGHYACRAARRR